MTTTAHEDQFTPAPVEVTQADRDAAFNTGLRLTKAEWLVLYDAFAHHRTASAPAGEVEPVAWYWTSSGGTRMLPQFTRDDAATLSAMEAEGWTEAPLYANPPAPADLVEALREALEHWDYCRSENRDPRFVPECWTAPARAVLAKHGGA